MEPERWRRIEQLYHLALEQEPAQQHLFLAEACQDDADLREEVESLLAQSGGTEGLADKTAWAEADNLAATQTVLTPGARLGPYQILGLLGEGGMGKVYRGLDTRLDRAVAIKISAEQFSKRFEHEARAISALNHPHICTLYDVGPSYMVTELVEGETLRDWLKSAPPVERSIEIARQALDALGAAHRAGIVHRDLKPQNIMVRFDGYVKVLDFGLAKRIPASGRLQADCTASQDPSLPGQILGTVAYMSPEQILGEEVDQRSDLFAFGVILYEMLTGQHPWPSTSPVDTQHAILRDDPAPMDGVAAPSAELASVVQKLLCKSPADRYQSAELVLKALADCAARPVSSAERHSPQRTRAAVGSATALGLVMAAVSFYWFGGWFFTRPKRPESRSQTFTQLTDQPGPELYPSLSPDGKSLVYQGRAAGKWDIYFQRVGGKNPLNLTKDTKQDNTQPAFSPDGERIAFRAEREGGGIFIMGATGENAKRLTGFGYHPAWSPDGKEIVCAAGGFETPEYAASSGPLAIVTVSTGEKRVITGSRDALQPQWSPHGQRIAYWARRDGGNPQRDIWTISSAGGEPVEVTNDPATDWNPVWSPDGRYLYFSSDRGGARNLWRVSIDEKSGKVQGSPEPVMTPSPYSWLMSFSHDGRRMAYVQQTRTSNLYSVRFDPIREVAVGKPTPVTQGSREAWLPDISPDGKWVTFASAGRQEDIFVSRVDGTDLRQLTDDIYKDRGPRWSPDGKQIAFFSDRSGKFQIWSIKPDGSGLRQLSEDRMALQGPNWSPDGARLAALRPFPPEVFVLEAAKTWKEQAPESLPPPGQGSAQFWPSSWSPDGLKLAGYYMVNGSFAGVVIYSFDTRRYQKLTEFGHAPRWLSDSRRLLFNHQGKLYLVDSLTKNVHQVALAPPYEINPWLFGLSRDNRLIVFSVAITEADIWQMNLD